MTATNNLAAFSVPTGQRLLKHVIENEKVVAPPLLANNARQLVGHTSPVEITGEWTQDGETWKCRAKRLWRIDGTYQMRDDGAEFDLYHPTSGAQPTQGIGERVFAIFRSVWELVSGAATGSGEPSAPRKIRLVQPKELSSACEYKTFQNVYGCEVQYSDDNDEWTTFAMFDIKQGQQRARGSAQTTPHKYWRVNLKGFSKPPVPNDPFADRGFYTYGQLREAIFTIQRRDEHEADNIVANATSSWEADTDGTETIEITFTPDAEHGVFFDSKPVPRKAGTPRYWQLTFAEPELVTDIELDVDRHHEHYIVCPGGRDSFKQDVKFIYSFDLVTEKWTATTFPELQKAMYNMEAKVVELEDGTHQLIILSGQTASGFSNIIQGYNFERDYIHNIVDFGDGALNFSGRPAFIGKGITPRSGFVSTLSASTLSSAIIIAGGGSRSVAIRGSASAIDTSLFALRGETLELDRIYEISTLNNNISLTGNTGLPFGMFDYTTQSSNAGAVGTRLQNQGKYVRHQNLPVRGVMRQRPAGNTGQPSQNNSVVDFLLIGGFNSVGNSEYNNTVVSGAFHSPTASAANSAQYQMRISRLSQQGNNHDSFLYFPDCDRVLGDCCAEYIEGRDEVICFGGRAAETDTAIAWDSLAVLVFSGNTATWNYTKYPAMPNPRWSAASVLIRDLVRKGETEPCDRIFIIGGRNKDGFVSAVDVFNLRYNRWETDWKGLNEGELEDYTASGTGGVTTIIVQGGGSSYPIVSAATLRQMLEQAGFEVE